jgi:hypothetical protein
LKQLKVNAKNIDWKSSRGILRASTSVIGAEKDALTPSGHVHDTPRASMYTGDPYTHLQVRIHEGDAKGNNGKVIGSKMSSDGAIILVVRTETRSVNHDITVTTDAVRERQ